MRTCHVCRVRMRASTIREAHGAAGPVKVTLTGLPCLACPSSHERVYLWPEFATALSSALWGGSVVPVADTVGLLKTTHTCSGCRARLADPSRLVETLAGTVRAHPDWPAFAPFEVAVTAPAAACPACGRVQLVFTEALVDVEDAIEAAFASAGLSP